MPLTTRAAAVAGLGLLGVTGLVAQSAGQQPRDGDVRKANNAPTAVKVVAPATIGTLDVMAVLNGYEKVKGFYEKLSVDMREEEKKLKQLAAELKSIEENMAPLKPGSPDFQKFNDRGTEMKAKFEATREKLQRDFAMRESDGMMSFYSEIQRMTALVAKKHGMTYVIRTTGEPTPGSDPQTLQNSIMRNVVYSDPAADITEEVKNYLNQNYRLSTGAAASKAAAPAAGGAGATRPAKPPR